jgi:hypothetical protein
VLLPTLSEPRRSAINKSIPDRTRVLAITAFDFRSRAFQSASRHIRALRHRRAGITSVRPSALHSVTNVRTAFAGVPMESVDLQEAAPEPISIARCRELLGDEAEAMSDQDVENMRRHAHAMACIMLELYQEHCRRPN